MKTIYLDMLLARLNATGNSPMGTRDDRCLNRILNESI